LTNVGSGKDHTINEYYNIIGSVLGYSGRFTNNINKPIGMKRKVLSIDKQNCIGWKPKTDLAKGIELAYKDFLKRIISCQ
jgi:GDP-L-fucose synthase